MEVGRFSPLHYGRDIRVSPHDACVLYASLSPTAQSTDGALYRSKDFEHSWHRFDHGSHSVFSVCTGLYYWAPPVC